MMEVMFLRYKDRDRQDFKGTQSSSETGGALDSLNTEIVLSI